MTSVDLELMFAAVLAAIGGYFIMAYFVAEARYQWWKWQQRKKKQHDNELHAIHTKLGDLQVQINQQQMRVQLLSTELSKLEASCDKQTESLHQQIEQLDATTASAIQHITNTLLLKRKKSK